jgi:hypothetical protein
MDSATVSFFEKLPATQKPVAMSVREHIMTAFPQVAGSIKWNQLTFHYRNTNLAFIYSVSADHLNLGFFNATSLHDPGTLFEGTGRRMRHIKLFPGSPFPEAQIISWFGEAVMQAEIKSLPGKSN